MDLKPVEDMTPEELAAEYTRLKGWGKAVYSGNGWIAFWASPLSPGCKVSFRVAQFRPLVILERKRKAAK